MKKLVRWLFVAAVVSACSNDEIDPLTEREKEMIAQLESAYEANDPALLSSFLEEWNRDVAPQEGGSISQNETIRSVYDVYKTFYFPDDPQYLGEVEEHFVPEDSLAHIIVQNRLMFEIAAEIDWEHHAPNIANFDTIRQFKPALEHLGAERILYLTDEYSNAINKFLGSEYTRAGTDISVPSSQSTEETKVRGEFLSNYLPIVHYWNTNWLLETHPKVDLIVLNEEHTEAIVYFKFVYQDGVAALEKIDGVWSIKNSKTSGIE